MGTNEIIYVNSAYCPTDSHGYKKCLIIVDSATSKVTAYPSKDLKSFTVQKHLNSYMLSCGIPRIVYTDIGTEFKKGLDEALAGLTSRLESTRTYVKGTTSQAENLLRLLKRAMTKLCLYKPEDWSSNLVLAVDSLNNSILYKKTTRNQLFFSPLYSSRRLNLLHL